MKIGKRKKKGNKEYEKNLKYKERKDKNKVIRLKIDKKIAKGSYNLLICNYKPISRLSL